MPRASRIHDTTTLIGTLTQPVSLDDARGLGITRGMLRTALDAGALHPLRRGFVLPTAVWESADPQQRHRLALTAALRAYPGSWASRESAALICCLPTRSPVLDGHYPHVHISRPGATAREALLTVHGNEVPDASVGLVGGLACTTLVRTGIETGAVRSLRWSLAVLDATSRAMIAAEHADIRQAVLDDRVRQATWATLDEAVGRYSRHRWVTTLRRALQLMDPAAESVLESMSRAEIAEAGLPVPRCGIPVRGDDGRIYWTDALWEDYRLIGEIDGLGKYADVGDLVSEKRRQEALEGAGWRMIRWGWAEAVTQPDIMLGRVRAALT